MPNITHVSYDFIKNNPLFDKEAERVYKMYPSPLIRIYTLEERRKSVALCVVYESEDKIVLFHFNSKKDNLVVDFINYFKEKTNKEFLIYLPVVYQNKFEKIILKNKFEYVDNIHSYVFVPSYSQNLSFWKEFYSKRGHKVINYLVEHGCDRCTFEESINDERFKELNLIEKLQVRLNNDEFDDAYNPFDNNDFDPHFSYIAYYKEKPIAYLTVKHINNILLLDHLSLSKEASHNGVSLILISKFINHVISDFEEEQDKYFEVRTKPIPEKSMMFKLIDGNLNKIIFQQREKILYHYKKKENS